MSLSVSGGRIHVARVHDDRGRLLPEFLTNVGKDQVQADTKPERKRGSILINVATGLLFALAIALYVVSITAQWAYVDHVKHDDIVSWIEAASLDGGMAVFTLLALGLSRAGQAARIERLMIVLCALGSAAMNYAAADTADVRSSLAYTLPPIFLAAVVDRTVSVIRRHYLGDDDASAWSNLGRVALYGARLLVAPWSTLTGARRALLAAAPVPEREKAVAEPVKMITLAELPWPPPAAGPVLPVKPRRELPPAAPRPPRAPKPKAPKPAVAPRTGTKTADLIRIATERHGELAVISLDQCSKIATGIAGEIGMHAGSARTALLKAARAARNGGAR